MRQQQNNMEVIVNFSIPERTKKMTISVENNLGISSEEWERLDEYLMLYLIKYLEFVFESFFFRVFRLFYLYFVEL